MNINKVRNRTRMFEWLLLALAFYTLSVMAHTVLPGFAEARIAQVETLSWKLGNAVVGAYLGYWADRTLIGRIWNSDTDLRVIARALIVAAFILGISSGI